MMLAFANLFFGFANLGLYAWLGFTTNLVIGTANLMAAVVLLYFQREKSREHL